MFRLLLVTLLFMRAHGELTEPSGCSRDYGCYSQGCAKACKFVVTWKDVGDTVEFSLLMPQATRDRWIALGLSSDTHMGGDSVTECVQNGGNLGIIQKSWNDGNPKNNVLLKDGTSSTAGLSATSLRLDDGVVVCRYTQTKVAPSNQIFDLNSDWYLLVATGNAKDGVKMVHSTTELPAVSPHKVDFQALESLHGAQKYIHAKIHGCLMIFAWVFCASIGIFLARFYKPMWPNISFFRERVWFVVHQTCMVFAVLFCVAAFIIIFVFEKKWSSLDGHTQWQKAHPYLGVIVTFLCVLNPILALLRPHPDSKNRFIFNWVHWFVGMCAFILAAMTLIIGVTLGKAEVPFSCSWVLLAWVIYQMIVMLLMDIVDCCVAGNRQWYKAEGRLKEPKWSLLRKVVLGVHVIIISCFTVACIVIVATG